MPFTETEIEQCRAAMMKPAPLDALRLIASGRVLIELTKDKRDVYIDSLDGRPVRDPDFPDRKMLLSGAWPLFRAGMIDSFGIITDEGRSRLSQLGALP